MPAQGMEFLELVQMAEEGDAAGAGQVYPILQVKGEGLLSVPSQTVELEPGVEDSGRQLRVEDHMGGDTVLTRGQGG
jgi:hypothetical protein